VSAANCQGFRKTTLLSFKTWSLQTPSRNVPQSNHFLLDMPSYLLAFFSLLANNFCPFTSSSRAQLFFAEWENSDYFFFFFFFVTRESTIKLIHCKKEQPGHQSIRLERTPPPNPNNRNQIIFPITIHKVPWWQW
jgi:hypothetical protein